MTKTARLTARARIAVMALAACTIASACARDPRAQAQRYVDNGNRFMQDGRPDAAVIEYRNAVKAWSSSIDARRRLGDALRESGRTAEAYQEYAAAERIVGDTILPYGEADLRSMVQQHPQSAAVHMALAETLISDEKTDEARAHLETAVSLDPSNELANRSLAALLIDQKETDEAEVFLRTAASQRPQRYRSELALTDFLIGAGRNAEARAVLEQMSDPELREPRALRLAALDYEAGAVENANRELTTALKLWPSAEAWTLQANFQLREGKLDQATASVKEALKIDPEFKPATTLMTKIRQKEVWSQPSPPARGLKDVN